MKIIIDKLFRHDRIEYTPEDRMTVPDALGGYFCGVGWAHEAGAEPSTESVEPEPVTLEVQSGRHANNATEL